jgi:hypothetical protein
MAVEQYGQPVLGTYTPKKKTTYAGGTFGTSTALPQYTPTQTVTPNVIYPTKTTPSGGRGYIAPAPAPTYMPAPSGLIDIYKALLGAMGQTPQIALPQMPDIQAQLEEARTAAYQQALKQKGVATRTIGEQAEETLKGISEIEDEEKRLAALDAAARGVYESGLLTQALAKVSEKYATGKTKVMTEKQSALDELEAALLGVKSAATLQTLPYMQQAWQTQYTGAMNMAQQQWQQRQAAMQNALNLYQMQLQDAWNRMSMRGGGVGVMNPNQYYGSIQDVLALYGYGQTGLPDMMSLSDFLGYGR